MNLEQQRNVVKLIGKFSSIKYEGAKVSVMLFEDKTHGSLSIGVLNDEPIALNVPYQIAVSLHGKEKIYDDGRVFNTNFLNLVSYEKIETNKQMEEEN